MVFTTFCVVVGEQEIETEQVQSKWELVDYGNGSSDEEEEVKPKAESVYAHINMPAM